jgi:hypothetical protein
VRAETEAGDGNQLLLHFDPRHPRTNFKDMPDDLVSDHNVMDIDGQAISIDHSEADNRHQRSNSSHPSTTSHPTSLMAGMRRARVEDQDDSSEQPSRDRNRPRIESSSPNPTHPSNPRRES